MLSGSQMQRITKKATTAILAAIDAFPTYLSRAEPESAASIVADLIKTQLTAPIPKVDNEKLLDFVLTSISDKEEKEENQ